MNFKVVKRKNALDLKSEKIKYSDDLTVKEYKDYLIQDQEIHNDKSDIDTEYNKLEKAS